METIRSYMESLFVKLPNTSDVRKAKAHLLEMAEDKYNSLLEEGLSDNEAVAKVIAEFGNLDELKEELGISETVNYFEKESVDVRNISLLEIKDIIQDYSKAAIIRGIGVMAFICCVVPCILIDKDYAPAFMFLLIGLGIAFMIIQASLKGRWNFLKEERCCVDMSGAEYVKEEKRRFSTAHLAMKAFGIMSICTCVVPAIILDNDFGPALMFIMIGFGVFLVVSSGGVDGCFDMLLNINPNNTIGGSYSEGSGKVFYENRFVGALMSIYWPLIVCLYLSVSFMTFSWGFTWFIFPAAWVVESFIKELCGNKE